MYLESAKNRNLWSENKIDMLQCTQKIKKIKNDVKYNKIDEKFHDFVVEKLSLEVNEDDISNILAINEYDLDKAKSHVEKNIFIYKRLLIGNFII